MRRRRAALFLPLALALACSAPAPKPRPPAEPPVSDDHEVLLPAVRDAYAGGRYERGLALVKRLVEVSPNKVVAYDRIGSTYFALCRGAEAVGMWETALALEKDPKRRADMAASLQLARRGLGLPEPPPDPAQPPPKPPKKRTKKAPRPADPAEVERLYQQGVDRYARSEYMAATTLFMQVLVLDPKHEGARKALDRLRLKPDLK